MNSTHVSQVATFEKLLGFCNAQGAAYNPAKDSLKMTAMNSLLTAAQQSVEAVNHAQAIYGQAVFSRKEAFGQLEKFMTRIVHALKVTNAPAGTIAEAYRYKKRFTGKTRPTQQTPSDAANGDPPPTEKTRIQRAFDNQLSNFETLLKVVTSEPSYLPNEADITSTALQAYLAKLREKNKAVLDAQVNLAAARKNRNRILYSADSMRQIALAVKAYVRSVFGTNSAIFRDISGLYFPNNLRKTKTV